MSAIYIFAVPGVPPSFNEFERWPDGKKRRIRDEWQEAVHYLCREKGNRAPRSLEQAVLRAVIFFPTGRRRDGDNYHMPLWKWVQDALVRAGVLIDDDQGRVRAEQPRFVVGEKPLTVITITYEQPVGRQPEGVIGGPSAQQDS